ncbi:uncharacterized protein LOC134813454 [Bolinopsis microptera]|uniref:uncharacterized protein LOC134813454 n=1 Tax=Bolinopsis microptera TaxID=2820187 RepID=UPI00307AC587
MSYLAPAAPSKGASDLLQFSIDAYTNLQKKMDNEGQFSDFKDAFRNIQYEDYKQEGRLVAITNKTGLLLQQLSKLVSLTAKKAEEAFYMTPPDPNVTFYDGDLIHHVIRGNAREQPNLNFTGKKEDLPLSERDDPRFGVKINPSTSVVRVAVDVYKGDSSVKHDIKMTARLQNLYKKHFNLSDEFLFQYFGTPNGVTRMYPAHHLPEFRYTYRGTRDYYDPRERHWYIEAISPPKDVLFLVDFSGSMDGIAQSIAKNLVKVLFNHLPSYDFLNIIAVNKDPFMPSDCFNSTLEKGTKEIKDNLKQSLDKVQIYGRANFTAAIDLAFKVLKRSEKAGKTNGCSRTLVVIGDGDVGSQIREVFDDRNKEFSATGNPVKVIVFRTTTTMERNDLYKVEEQSIIEFACGNGGEYVKLSDNTDIYSAVRNFTDFFLPESVHYDELNGNQLQPLWTHVYKSYSNLSPAASLVQPVLVSNDYNFYSYHNKGEEYTGKIITRLERERVRTSPNSSSKLLGVVGVDFPIFEDFVKDKILSNYVRVITSRGEHVITHPDITGTTRQFEYQQVERGPDKEKIRDMQESHGAGTVKYTGLQVFLTSKHNPIGREILVDTVYKVKPMIGSPFTVGLSLPVRLDYQYTFFSQSDIDLGRMVLETSESNIIFRSFRKKKCQGVLQYLRDESQKRLLGEMILTELQKLSSSDEIRSSLLCLYDLYLPSLMEGFAMKNILNYWKYAMDPNGPKIFFHSSTGNIFVTPQMTGNPRETTDVQEEHQFVKMTSSDPVEVLYLSLPSYSSDEGTLLFNLSRRIPLPDQQHRPDQRRVAGMLTYQISHSVLQNSLWGYHLTNALNSPQDALYALDEHGFVVFVLTQEDSEIQLKSIAEFLESSNHHDNMSYSYRDHVFFGQIQPVMMEALVERGIYKRHTLDKCKERCTDELCSRYNPTGSSPRISSLFSTIWFLFQQLMTKLLLKQGPEPVSAAMNYCRSGAESYGTCCAASYDMCCTAHHLYTRDLLFTSSASFSCDFRRSSGLCNSRPVLVQPVEGSNLLFVLDPDKKGRCVASSKLARSDPTCQDHVIPMLINRDPSLQSNLSVCNFAYSSPQQRVISPTCLKSRADHECSGTHGHFTWTSWLLTFTFTFTFTFSWD